MNGPEVITMGCRLNAAESEAMRLLAAGEEDLIIVNSCAVTNEAVRQTRQAIRKAKRARPDARVVVTGCAAQIDPERFAAMPEVARVIGNREKFDAASFSLSRHSPEIDRPPCPPDMAERLWGTVSPVQWNQASAGQLSQEKRDPRFRGGDDGGAFGAEILVSDIMAVRETASHLISGFSERARAFVEVQNGCDHRCTFCIIPYGRGNSRSVPAGLVIDRIKALVDAGFREVVLTGVDLTSYGPDLPGSPTLGQLVGRILKLVPGLERLRLSSIDSVEIDDHLFDLITGEPRLMPHLHLSLQAGDDMVLKRMKRRHSRAQAVDMVGRLKSKRPEIAIGADLIAGFPTETDAMALNSEKLIEDCDIVMGHIFPFSPRSGTPAARMPKVDPAIVKERARRLRVASARRRADWLQDLVGTHQRVLVEREDGFGHGESFAPARIAGAPVGEVTAAYIRSVEDDVLIGEAA